MKKRTPAAPPDATEVVRYMMAEPADALVNLAGVYARLVRDGRAELAPTAEVLAALAEARPDDLTGSSGPRAWARAHRRTKARQRAARSTGKVVYVGTVAALPKSASDDAKDLAAALGRAHDRGASSEALAHAAYVHLVQAQHLWGDATAVAEEDMRLEIDRVLRRAEVTHKALAVAALVAWGVPRKAANERLRGRRSNS